MTESPPAGFSSALDPEAHAIVYDQYVSAESADPLGGELRRISEVDRAHLIMLGERGVVEPVRAAALLRAVQELRDQNFGPVRGRPMPRGVYLAYEGFLIERLGDETGGILHTGRSRNDLNATTARLKARTPYLALLDAVDRLAAVLLEKADRYAHVTIAGVHARPARGADHLRALPDGDRGRGTASVRPTHRRRTSVGCQPARQPARSAAPLCPSTPNAPPNSWGSPGLPPTRWTPWPPGTSRWTFSPPPRCSASRSPGSPAT